MPKINGYEIRYPYGSQGHMGDAGPAYPAYSEEEAQKAILLNSNLANATLHLIADARYIQTALGVWDNERQIYLRIDKTKREWVAFSPDQSTP